MLVDGSSERPVYSLQTSRDQFFDCTVIEILSFTKQFAISYYYFELKGAPTGTKKYIGE